MKHRNTVSAVVFALILLPCMSFAQTGERAVNINPVGVLFQGLSYVEYEYMIAPTVSIAARLDNFRYKYNEKETNYTYDEKGNGFGLGGGVRFYLKKEGVLDGLFGGIGVEFVQEKWEWTENDYGYHYEGDGTTFAFALHFQAGYKIKVNENIYVEPSFYSGWFSMSEEDIEGFGIFVSPALSVGFKLGK